MKFAPETFRVVLVVSATISTLAALALVDVGDAAASRLVAGLLAFLASWVPRSPHVPPPRARAHEVPEPETSTRRTDPPERPPALRRFAFGARRGALVYGAAELCGLLAVLP